MKTNSTLLFYSFLKNNPIHLRIWANACLFVLFFIGFSCVQEEDINTSVEQELTQKSKK